MECAYLCLHSGSGIDRVLVLWIAATGVVFLPWYIMTTVSHPIYQPFFLLDHQRDARPDHGSPCYPHWEWNVPVSSQADRICGQSHRPNLVYRWDYLTTLWLEFRLIRGKMKLRWPLVRLFPRSFCTRTQSSRFHTSSPAIRAWDLLLYGETCPPGYLRTTTNTLQPALSSVGTASGL